MLGAEGVLTCLDDLLIHSIDTQTRLNLLKLNFQSHREALIILNAEKTFLMFPLLYTEKELSALLGFAGYYKEFLPGFA